MNHMWLLKPAKFRQRQWEPLMLNTLTRTGALFSGEPACPTSHIMMGVIMW